MSKPPISTTKFTDTIKVSECHDGFWLYDASRGMNLAIREKTRDAAFVKALTYYQDRLADVEARYAALKVAVKSFVDTVKDDDDE